ncbi:hypothetical protein [Halosegnis marinus]|uniref:Uncharacterized protein n=1 Tax=Halosegnis marinus TaxID=3034023 RepID=A0ABD5ZQQ9_9EURY|nr:hypothetical protein [Halosegnis sp. DT85]
MPSRRTLLTGAAAAGATALAGCSTGDALDPATQGDTPTAPEDATVVATAERSVDADPPNGAFRVSAAVHERPAGDRTELHLLTDHRLIPGENQHANNGWRLAELGVEHVSDATTVTGGTNFRRPDEGESAAVRLGSETTPSGRRWTVRFGDSGDATWSVTAYTVSETDRDPAAGDRLAEVRTHVRETKPWSTASYEATRRTSLVYGEDR